VKKKITKEKGGKIPFFFGFDDFRSKLPWNIVNFSLHYFFIQIEIFIDASDFPKVLDF